jgi:phage terminase large subunit-like protein
LSEFIEWPEGFDPEVVKQWKPEARQKAAELLQDAKTVIQFWYCKRGRLCDGKPHKGYEYRHARGDQWPPPSNDDWMYWLLRGGRGSGKTRSGAEWVREMRKHVGRIAIIGPTSASVRDVQIEGESGLLFVCDRAGVRVKYEPSKSRLTFLDTGCIAHTYSAEEPDRLRGPQHGAGWLDEPAHYKNIDYVWSMFMYGLRLGVKPRVCLTTTPLPNEWLFKMMDDPKSRQSVVSTFANSDNLADFFLEEMRNKHAGTRLGRQELEGEVLMDVEGALWNTEMIDPYREKNIPSLVDFAQSMEKIVVAIDPAGTSTQRSDETGIVVVGMLDGRGYVIDDKSGKYKPAQWARKAVGLYETYQADAIVVENNYGGEMVRSTLENISERPRIREVNSRRGKFIRAEPVVALYEQGKISHVNVLDKLETQLVSWVPGKGKSPDRLDALVHGLTDVMSISPPAEMALPKGLGKGKNGPFGYRPPGSR